MQNRNICVFNVSSVFVKFRCWNDWSLDDGNWRLCRGRFARLCENYEWHFAFRHDIYAAFTAPNKQWIKNYLMGTFLLLKIIRCQNNKRSKFMFEIRSIHLKEKKKTNAIFVGAVLFGTFLSRLRIFKSSSQWTGQNWTCKTSQNFRQYVKGIKSTFSTIFQYNEKKKKNTERKLLKQKTLATKDKLFFNLNIGSCHSTRHTHTHSLKHIPIFRFWEFERRL